MVLAVCTSQHCLPATPHPIRPPRCAFGPRCQVHWLSAADKTTLGVLGWDGTCTDALAVCLGAAVLRCWRRWLEALGLAACGIGAQMPSRDAICLFRSASAPCAQTPSLPLRRGPTDSAPPPAAAAPLCSSSWRSSTTTMTPPSLPCTHALTDEAPWPVPTSWLAVLVALAATPFRPRPRSLTTTKPSQPA